MFRILWNPDTINNSATRVDELHLQLSVNGLDWHEPRTRWELSPPLGLAPTMEILSVSPSRGMILVGVYVNELGYMGIVL